jgi:hypothetical protein
MKNDHDACEGLGVDVRNGAPLPHPFTEATARDVACGIHAALVEVGLSPSAIKRVGATLIGLSDIDGRKQIQPR